MRHPVPFDEAQKVFRIEAFHDDGSAAHADREVDPDMRRRMIQRCGREIDQAVPEPPQSLA